MHDNLSERLLKQGLDQAIEGSKKSILILNSTFHLGGAERITHAIVRGLSLTGYRPVLCSLYEPGPGAEWFVRDGFPFHSRLIRSRFDFRVLWKLAEIMHQEAVELIYLVNQPLTAFWGLIAGKQRQIPVVGVVHNTVMGNASLKLRVNRIFLKGMDAVVAVANMQKRHLIETEGVRADLIRVIHNGIDFERFLPKASPSELRIELNLDPRFPVVGVVARLVTLKGIDIFLEAAKQILCVYPNTQFVVVGDGPEAKTLVLLAKRLGIESSVRFLLQRDDIADIVQLFTIAVLSSRTEALPMAIIEYMSLEKAVVATRVGSVPEIVVHGETGILVSPENSKALGEGVLALLRNPAVARAMGVRGRSRVENSFSIENTVSGTQRLLAELLSS